MAIERDRRGDRRQQVVGPEAGSGQQTPPGECHAERFGKELLDRYAKVSVFEAARRNEPFIGLKRVELENAVESYRDRLDAARMVKSLR